MAVTLSIDPATMADNLAAFENDASLPWAYAYEAGAPWYGTMRSQCMEWSAEYGIEWRRIAAIVAIMSSTMGWEKNKNATVAILRAWTDGKRGRDLPAVTRNYLCVVKAERILMGDDPNETIVKRGRARSQSWKTLCFWYNIIGRSTSRVTVDVWMWRILSGDRKSQFRPEGAEYLAAERIIRDAARKRGIRPCDYQAILWVALTGIAA